MTQRPSFVYPNCPSLPPRATEARLHPPLGSGVTEAGCKTVYAQRLKLSGMSWGKAGAQTILDLRVVVLSGVWDAAYARVLAGFEQPRVRGHRAPRQKRAGKAE